MQQPRVLDQVPDRIRRKHHSLRTEDAYVHIIRRDGDPVALERLLAASRVRDGTE